MAVATPPTGDRPTPPSSDARERAGRLSLAFATLLLFVVGLMTLGALVRAHEAGLACPDWPLCFGELVPQMDLKVAFEWSHRALAGSIGLVFAVLAVRILRQPALAARLRTGLGVAAVLLAVQILLGALTVWELLAAWTVTSHLLVANAFAMSLLFVTLRLRELASPPSPRPTLPRPLRTLGLLCLVLILIQVALGGMVSSTFAGLACPEWPACNGGEWFPSWRGSVGLHLVHRTNGYLVWILLTANAWLTRGVPGLRGAAVGAWILASAQVLVGIANVVLALPVEVTGLHSLLAALLVLATSAAAYAALWRRGDTFS